MKSNVNNNIVYRASDLSFKYKRGSTHALSGIDLTLSAGLCLGILGANGAGKSTLCFTSNGLIPKEIKGEMTGSIEVFGQPTINKTVNYFSDKVGILFQDFSSQIFSSTVELEIAFGLENIGCPPDKIRSRITEALEITGLSGLEERPTYALSGGQQQRLALASLLAMNPGMLVLDEPLSDLDPEARAILLPITREQASKSGQTIIIVEQDPENIMFSDQWAIVTRGTIKSLDEPKKLLKDTGLLKENGVKVPELAGMAAMLGWPNIPLSIEQAKLEIVRSDPEVDTEAVDRLIRKDKDRQGSFSEAIIEARGIEYSYPNGLRALKDISFNISRGECVAILGHNGSGKTTLLKTFNGLLQPQSGRISVSGEIASGRNLNMIRKKVAYVCQNPDHMIFRERVVDEVAVGLKFHKIPASEWPERIDEAIKAVELDHVREADPFTLTKGDRQKVALASILALRPEVILLDEPVTGLDASATEKIMALLSRLNEKGHTIIMSTHHLKIACGFADRILMMKEGNLTYDGPVREAFTGMNKLDLDESALPASVRVGKELGVPALTVDELTDCIKQKER